VQPNETLRNLAASVTPTTVETAVATKHFGSIKVRLQQSFEAKRFIPIGSHARGTAIQFYSDIDFLAVLPRSIAKWGNRRVAPKTFLKNVAEDLEDRYTTTRIRTDGQAVVLYFSGGSQSVDLVPGVFEGMNGNRPMYLIPGNAEEWISTSPETHDLIFKNADERSGGKLKRVARLLKAWKHGRQTPVPLPSFYTDILLATTDVASGVKTYGQCLRDFFSELVQRQGRGLRDPGKVAGIITASTYSGQRDAIVNAARYAREHADRAMYAERIRDSGEAVRQWGIVFNRDL
jgi:hypothetical protein